VAQRRRDGGRLPDPFWPIIVTLDPSSTEKEVLVIRGLVRAYSKETSLKERIEPNRFCERQQEAEKVSEGGSERDVQGMSFRARREEIFPLNKLIALCHLKKTLSTRRICCV
jgi:hypothetical protein